MRCTMKLVQEEKNAGGFGDTGAKIEFENRRDNERADVWTGKPDDLVKRWR